ncbi:(2Fe-2S)-binding protein, partial [Streptomyces ardesiacus]|uniref:(2Fe-2S)-binding protein n=1 Tax=Streptomyces ardesiacus TaxID=285564 RepID=UPI00363D9401
RTTVPALYTAGETCGVGGAALAVHEGRLAAWSVLADSGAAAPAPANRAREVTAGAVRTARADGAHDHRQVKQLTRAGMGWCQGRMCGPAVHCLTGRGRVYEPAERLVATPVTLGALAGLDEEPTDNAEPDKECS